MSLVAYGASDDDSDQSDSECPKVVGKNRDDPISDDEDIGIQTNSNSSGSTSSTSMFNSKSLFDIGTTTKDLPPLKTENVIIEETELEEEVRQKPSELADAPKPPKKTKQPVKITIPSLNDIPDEEDSEGKQKPVASTVRSGLFSLLPAPIHSAKKEINRPLIPHNLGKRAPSTKPANDNVKSSQVKSNGNNNPATINAHSAASINKNATIQTALIGYGSDSSDDDDTSASQNFFSLGSKTLTTDSNSSKTVKETVAAAVELKSDGHNIELKTDTSPLQEDEIVTLPEPGLTNDSPLSFSNPGRSWSGASTNYSGGLKSSHQAANTSSYNMSYPQSIGQVSSDQYNMVGTDDTEHMDETEDDLQKMLNDKEFQKLNGKRKRGMDEAINFVDAKVDDYVDPSELSKYVTEETEYTSKKNKDDMPTSQQRRKKQITYLAFQAKEKELELKNTWANNKLTRRQTQAKYGF